MPAWPFVSSRQKDQPWRTAGDRRQTMGGANSRPSNNGVLTKKELERMQRRFAPCHHYLTTPSIVLQPYSRAPVS